MVAQLGCHINLPDRGGVVWGLSRATGERSGVLSGALITNKLNLLQGILAYLPTETTL